MIQPSNPQKIPDPPGQGPDSRPDRRPGTAVRRSRTYYSRQTEKKLFFYLTLVMLAAGFICRFL